MSSGEVEEPDVGGREQGDFLEDVGEEEESLEGDFGVPEVEGGREPEAEGGGEPPERRGDRDRRALARARELVEEERIEDAVALYRKLIRQNPGQVKARNNLGVLYDETGAHERALEEFVGALEIEPENVGLLVNQASALASLSRFDEAERVLARAERLEPGAPDVRRARGILSYRRGLYAEAAEALETICRREPDDGVAQFYLGESLNRLGRVEEALDALEKAVEIHPENHRAYYTLGILYDKLHLPQQAALMYRKSRKLQASS